MNETKIIRCWKQSTGSAFRNGSAISFGLKGSADISGIILGGIRLEIECKTGNAIQSDQQIKFQAMIEKFGGIYILVRSVEQVYDQLQKIFRLRRLGLSLELPSPIQHGPTCPDDSDLRVVTDSLER